MSPKLAFGIGGTALLYDQLNKRYGGGLKMSDASVEATASPEGSTPSGGSSNVSMNEPSSSTDVGTASNPSKEEVPFWVKNQAYIQKEVDKGTGFVKSPDGGSSTEFQNQYINSQLRDANSPMSQALARMNRNTVSSRQAEGDRESIQYGNVPVSRENRQMLNNPVAYTNQSPARGAVGTGNMSVNTSTPVGFGVTNPNSLIRGGGAFGNTASLGLGMQSFNVPETPTTRAEIERNMAMQNMNGPDVSPENRTRLEAENYISGSARSVGNAVSGAAGRAVSTARDVLGNAASYIPTGARGEVGPSGEELQDQADAVMEEKRNANYNLANSYTDLADSIGYNIEDGNFGYEDGLLGDAIDLGLNVSGDMYTSSLLGQAPAMVKNTLTGQYGAKSAAAMGRNETIRSTLGKQAWKQTGQAMAQSYAKGASTVGGVARSAGTGAMRLAGKAMPYYSLIDAGISGGEELFTDKGVRTAYHGGGAKGKAMGTGAAVLNGLTMGAYDTIAANYGPSDYGKKTGASKDPLGTAWLTEQFYNKFIK
jgi:hypothetical protein